MVVGDSIFDMQMARNANALGVGELTASANHQQFMHAGAVTIIDDISYLPNLLPELNEK